MRKRITTKQQMVLKVGCNDRGALDVKVYEPYFEKLDEKQKYLELRGIINDHDPMFVFLFGPDYEDEYHGIINLINKGLYAYMDSGQVHDLVCEIFENRFGISCRADNSLMNKQRYKDLADEIYNWLNYGMS